LFFAFLFARIVAQNGAGTIEMLDSEKIVKGDGSPVEEPFPDHAVRTVRSRPAGSESRE
jgi:hypothetical protein